MRDTQKNIFTYESPRLTKAKEKAKQAQDEKNFKTVKVSQADVLKKERPNDLDSREQFYDYTDELVNTPEMGDFYIGAVDTDYLEKLDEIIHETDKDYEKSDARRAAFYVSTPYFERHKEIPEGLYYYQPSWTDLDAYNKKENVWKPFGFGDGIRMSTRHEEKAEFMFKHEALALKEAEGEFPSLDDSLLKDYVLKDNGNEIPLDLSEACDQAYLRLYGLKLTQLPIYAKEKQVDIKQEEIINVKLDDALKDAKYVFAYDTKAKSFIKGKSYYCDFIKIGDKYHEIHIEPKPEDKKKEQQQQQQGQEPQQKQEPKQDIRNFEWLVTPYEGDYQLDLKRYNLIVKRLGELVQAKNTSARDYPIFVEIDEGRTKDTKYQLKTINKDTGEYEFHPGIDEAMLNKLKHWFTSYAKDYVGYKSVADNELTNIKNSIERYEDNIICEVIDIYDGDSIKVLSLDKRYRYNEIFMVRLYGIDAPEKDFPGAGERATEEIKKWISVNEYVTLDIANTEAHGRPVAEIYNKNNININKEMLRSGWVIYYERYNEKSSEYRPLEQEALLAKRGLYADNIEDPETYRRDSERKLAKGKKIADRIAKAQGQNQESIIADFADEYGISVEDANSALEAYKAQTNKVYTPKEYTIRTSFMKNDPSDLINQSGLAIMDMLINRNVQGKAYVYRNDKRFGVFPVFIDIAKYLLSDEREEDGIKLSDLWNDDEKVENEDVFDTNYNFKDQKYADAFKTLLDNYDDRKDIQKKIFGKTPKELRKWTVTIGDVTFFIPPTNISLTSEVDEERQSMLRAKGSGVSAHRRVYKTLSMELFFYGEKGINGYPYKCKTPNGEEITYYMNGLRALISQFKFTPFLPIENDYINNQLGIESVIFNSLSLSNVHEIGPKLIRAEVTFLEFDYNTFMPEHSVLCMENDIFDNVFSKAFNWEVFRYYYQRALISGNELLKTNFAFNSKEYGKELIKNRTSLQPMNFRDKTIKIYTANTEELNTILAESAADRKDLLNLQFTKEENAIIKSFAAFANKLANVAQRPIIQDANEIMTRDNYIRFDKESSDVVPVETQQAIDAKATHDLDVLFQEYIQNSENKVTPTELLIKDNCREKKLTEPILNQVKKMIGFIHSELTNTVYNDDLMIHRGFINTSETIHSSEYSYKVTHENKVTREDLSGDGSGQKIEMKDIKKNPYPDITVGISLRVAFVSDNLRFDKGQGSLSSFLNKVSAESKIPKKFCERALSANSTFNDKTMYIPFKIEMSYDEEKKIYVNKNKNGLELNTADPIMDLLAYFSKKTKGLDLKDKNQEESDMSLPDTDFKQPAVLNTLAGLSFDPYEIDDLILESFTCYLGNKIAKTSLIATDGVCPQYLGGEDTVFEMQFKTINKRTVKALNQLLKMISKNSKKYRRIMPSFPIRIESEITKLLGTYEISIQSINIFTIEKQPGVYHVSMSFRSVDRTLKSRETLKMLSVHNEGEVYNSEEGLRNILAYLDASNKLAKAEVYPDLELPTIREMEKLGFNFVRYKFQDGRVYVDPDFYFLYFSKLSSQVIRDSVLNAFEEGLTGRCVFTDKQGVSAEFYKQDDKPIEILPANEEARRQKKAMKQIKKKKNELLSERAKKEAKEQKIRKLNNRDDKMWKIGTEIHSMFFEKRYLDQKKDFKVGMFDKKGFLDAIELYLKQPIAEDIKTIDPVDDFNYKNFLRLYYGKVDNSWLTAKNYNDLSLKYDSKKKHADIDNDEDVLNAYEQKEKEIKRYVCQILESPDIIQILRHGLIDLNPESAKYLKEVVSGLIYASACEATATKEYCGIDTNFSWRPSFEPYGKKMVNTGSGRYIIDIEKPLEIGTKAEHDANREKALNEVAENGVEFSIFNIKMYSEQEINFIDDIGKTEKAEAKALAEEKAKKEAEEKKKAEAKKDAKADDKENKDNKESENKDNKDKIDDKEKEENKVQAITDTDENKTSKDKKDTKEEKETKDTKNAKEKTPGIDSAIQDSTADFKVNKNLYLLDPYYRTASEAEIKEYKRLCVENTKFAVWAYFRILLFWLKKAYEKELFPSFDGDVQFYTTQNALETFKKLNEQQVANVEDEVIKNHIDFFFKNKYRIDAGKFWYVILCSKILDMQRFDLYAKANNYGALDSFIHSVVDTGKDINMQDKEGLILKKIVLALAGQDLMPDLHLSGKMQKSPMSQRVTAKLETEYIKMANEPSKYLVHSCHDMVVHDARGRMLRAFPAFYMLFVDEGRTVGTYKLHDNFYTSMNLLNIEVVKSRKMPADMAIIHMTNIYNNYQETENITGFDDEDATSIGDVVKSVFRPGSYAEDKLEAERKLQKPEEHINLKPGGRIHLRMGYGSNPLLMPVVFNGVIAEVSAQDVVEIVAQGDGVELTQPMFEDIDAYELLSTDKFAATWFKNGATPKEILNHLFTNTGGVIADTLKDHGFGGLLGRYPYGMYHFGCPDFTGIEASGEPTQNIFEVTSNQRWKDNDLQTSSYAPKITFDLFGKTPWDIMNVCRSVSPEFIAAVAPFGFRSTAFVGKPKYYYAYDYTRAKGLLQERRKPYRQFHIYSSESDIIGNGIVATESEMKTVAIGLYENVHTSGVRKQNRVGPLYADYDIYPEKQKTMIVDTQLVGRGVPILGAIFTNSIVAFLDYCHIRIGDKEGSIVNNDLLAEDMTISALRDSVMDMYDGNMIVFGDPSVKPHDRIQIADSYEGIQGQAGVKEVVHTLSIESGFTTSITPDCIVSANDPEEYIANSWYNGISMIATAKILMAYYASKFVIGTCKSLYNEGVKKSFCRSLDYLSDLKNHFTPKASTVEEAVDFPALRKKFDGSLPKDFKTSLNEAYAEQSQKMKHDLIRDFKKANRKDKLTPKKIDNIINKKIHAYKHKAYTEALKQYDIRVTNTTVRGQLLNDLDKFTKGAFEKKYYKDVTNLHKAMKEANVSEDIIKVVKRFNNVNKPKFLFKNATKTIKNINRIAKGAKFINSAIFGAFAPQILMMATIMVVSHALTNWLEDKMRALECVKVFPLKRGKEVWVAGFDGTKGAVVGSPTEHHQGLYHRAIASSFTFMKSDQSIMDFAIEKIFYNDDLEFDQSTEGTNKNNDNAFDALMRTSTANINANNMASTRDYSYIQITPRTSNKEELSQSFDYFKILDITNYTQDKNFMKLKRISSNIDIKKHMDTKMFRIAHEESSFETPKAVKEETIRFNTELIQFKALKGMTTQNTPTLDVPFLSMDAMLVLSAILDKCTFHTSKDPIEIQKTYETNFIMLTSATVIGDNTSIASTGYGFTLQAHGPYAIAALNKGLEELQTEIKHRANRGLPFRKDVFKIAPDTMNDKSLKTITVLMPVVGKDRKVDTMIEDKKNVKDRIVHPVLGVKAR